MEKRIPDTMHAVLLTGYGGFDKLEYRTDVPIPEPGPDDVLIQVGAAGLNNTDINTRIGWYSKTVTTDTNQGGSEGFETVNPDDASWQGMPLTFPRIQGADCCGRIAAVGDAVAKERLGERVIVRNMLRSYVNYRPFECWTLGSECDGAFAQFVKAPAKESYAINCEWTDAELASIPCAYSTAENMLHRVSIESGEKVLITGASGGVGSAAVQLAKRRGAHIIAVAGKAKVENLKSLGAQSVINRGEPIADAVGPNSIDAVIDLVAGPQWPELLDVLKIGGRYACAGAIAGPLVELDVRTLYLKDLTLIGCTFQEDVVF
jgi:NADPH:quinone reductase-like Zn-dependent oxidoreductase